MSEDTKRKLAAVLSVDVVGYSRLIEKDETGTIASLRAHRSDLIDGKINAYGGRIVKTMGDGLLLEFPSVVDTTLLCETINGSSSGRFEVRIPESGVYRFSYIDNVSLTPRVQETKVLYDMDFTVSWGVI